VAYAMAERLPSPGPALVADDSTRQLTRNTMHPRADLGARGSEMSTLAAPAWDAADGTATILGFIRELMYQACFGLYSSTAFALAGGDAVCATGAQRGRLATTTGALGEERPDLPMTGYSRTSIRMLDQASLFTS
jgi:hypothetical protein